MLGEQHLEVRVGEVRGVVDQLPIAHRRQVRPVRTQLVHRAFVGEHVGQIRRREHPVEGLADLLRQLRAVEAGLDDELRHTRRIAEERVVDVLRGHPGRAMAEHAQRAGVQVAVAAGDAEEHTLVVGEFVGRHHADAVVGVAEPELRTAEPVGVLEVLERQRRHRVGEHLPDVGPSVEIPLLAQFGLHQPLVDHRLDPPVVCPRCGLAH